MSLKLRKRPRLPAQPNQSLRDGLRCLQVVLAQSQGIGVRELARQLGMETTRVHRLLKTLAHLGFIHQDQRKRYIGGPAVHVLAAQSLHASGILKRSLPILRQCSSDFPAAVVALGVLWENSVSYLYHAEPQMTVEEAVGRIHLYPALRSSIGHMLLSLLTDEERLARFGSTPPDLSGNHAYFATIRHQGFCFFQEQPDAHYSIAVPVFNGAAAVALSGIHSRSDAKLAAEYLQQLTSQI